MGFQCTSDNLQIQMVYSRYLGIFLALQLFAGRLRIIIVTYFTQRGFRRYN